MRRRSRRWVLAAVAVGVTAGCTEAAAPSGPRNPPSEADARGSDPTEPDDGGTEFWIAEWDFFEADDGTLLVTATVANEAPSERSGTLVARVTIDDETHEGRTDVTVPADDAVEAAVAVAVPFERFDVGGSLFLDLERTG